MASRGLDIQGVDAVINYDIPMNSKVYTLDISDFADQCILFSVSRRSCICILSLIINVHYTNSGLYPSGG